MTTLFPNGIDTFVNPTATNTLDQSTVRHDLQHANANDSIFAIETALGANLSKVKPGNTIVLFGDSITAYNGGPTIASPTSYWDSKGFFTWGNILLGGRLKILSNAGIAGDHTYQMLARISTDVLAFNPSWVHIMGGRNDDGVTAGQLTADTISNLTSIYSKCLGAGIRVVAGTILPGPTTDTANKIQHDDDVNRWIRDYVRSNSGIILNDMGEAVTDVTTDWRSLATLTVDRIHPNSPGAAVMGKKFAAVMSPLVSGADLLAAGAGTENFLANPYTNGSGITAPTSWTQGGGTATKSYVPRTDNVQGSWFQAAVANGGTAFYTQNIALAGAFAVGASCYFVAEVQCDTLDSAPAANTQAFYIYMQCYNGSTFTTKAFAAYWDTSYVNVPFPGSAGIFTTTAMIIPAGTTLVQCVISMNGGGNYRVGRAAVRIGTP